MTDINYRDLFADVVVNQIYPLEDSFAKNDSEALACDFVYSVAMKVAELFNGGEQAVLPSQGVIDGIACDVIGDRIDLPTHHGRNDDVQSSQDPGLSE